LETYPSLEEATQPLPIDKRVADCQKQLYPICQELSHILKKRTEPGPLSVPIKTNVVKIS